MDREQVVSRIVKLRALSSSKNPHEARSAEEAARRLEEKHNVTRAEVEAALGADWCEVGLGCRGWGVDWKLALVTAAARRCGAEVVSFRVGAKGRRVTVCGRKDDVRRARELFAGLGGAVSELRGRLKILLQDLQAVGRDLGREVRARGPRECLDSWYLGCVRGIAEILRRSGQVPGLVRTSAGARTEVEARWSPEEVRSGVSTGNSSSWYQLGREEAVRSIYVSSGGDVSVW